MEIKYDTTRRLGKGGHGTVFLGTFDSKAVAVKRIDLLDANAKEEEALKKLDHTNIAKLIHVESTEEFRYFALELCEASLDHIFLRPNDPQKYKGPNLPHYIIVFSQLALGLAHIHSNCLIHRDIKPANVLIHVDTTGKITMKWADFGLCRSVSERGTFTMSSEIQGTKNWYAPELLNLVSQQQQSDDKSDQPRGTVKSDVFALGLVFAYFLLDGEHIYSTNDFEIPSNILANNQVNKNKIANHYALKLLENMLAHEVDDRYLSNNVVAQLNVIEKLPEKEKELRLLCKDTSLDFKKFKLLIQLEIDVNGKDEDGNNALHLLCINNTREILIDAINLLVKFRIDVKGENNYGNNALHLLCLHNSSEGLIDAIKLLIQHGIDVNSRDNYGRNALHYLCYFNSSDKLIDAIELLIEHKIDVHGTDKDGWNALHLLCRFNSSEKYYEAITLLIRLGIDVKSNDIDARNLLRNNSTFNQSEKNNIMQLLDRATLAKQ